MYSVLKWVGLVASIRNSNSKLASMQRVGPVTDLTRWRLTNRRGRQTWEYYDESDGKEGQEKKTRREQNFVELHSLGLDTVSAQCMQPFSA